MGKHEEVIGYVLAAIFIMEVCAIGISPEAIRQNRLQELRGLYEEGAAFALVESDVEDDPITWFSVDVIPGEFDGFTFETIRPATMVFSFVLDHSASISSFSLVCEKPLDLQAKSAVGTELHSTGRYLHIDRFLQGPTDEIRIDFVPMFSADLAVGKTWEIACTPRTRTRTLGDENSSVQHEFNPGRVVTRIRFRENVPEPTPVPIPEPVFVEEEIVEEEEEAPWASDFTDVLVKSEETETKISELVKSVDDLKAAQASASTGIDTTLVPSATPALSTPVEDEVVLPIRAPEGLVELSVCLGFLLVIAMGALALFRGQSGGVIIQDK